MKRQSKFVRRFFNDISGYVPGEQLRGDYTRLNTNENPYPPSPRVLDAIRRVDPENLRIYPDSACRPVREKLAAIFGLQPDQFLVGNGSDEVLSLIMRVFVEVGETVVSTNPSYLLYDTLCQLSAARQRKIELTEDWQLPAEAFSAQGKVFFLANPNSPTGTRFDRESVERLCGGFNGLVVLDEAYCDFSNGGDMDLVGRYPNVIVCRSFSKSYSMAGMRVGLAAASEEIISELVKAKDSYNVNAVSQAAALAALEDIEYMRQNARKIAATRRKLISSLIGLGFKVPESVANFVLAFCESPPEAERLYRELKERKILVRYYPQPRVDNALRITVGTDAQIETLLDAIRDLRS